MKSLNTSLFLILICFLLVACGTDKLTQELKDNDTNKATAKVDQPVASGSTAASAAVESPAPSADDKEDFWTYYNDAKWSDDFNGLKSEIQKVAVSDKAPSQEDPEKLHSVVGVKFRMENTTKNVFTAYPDQAVLVTSTGEQIDNPDMWLSESIGGEIEEGVIKEGNIIWSLKRGHATDIKWVKLQWRAYEDDDPSKGKEYSVKIQLK